MSDRTDNYLFVCVLIALLCLGACLMAGAANGAEQPKGEWVRVSVKTDTTVNSGTGYYLGGGVVVAEQELARGSINMRAKVTFPCGKIYHGTIIFQDRRPALCFIKLDHMPKGLRLVGRYHQRGRTSNFFRRVV